MGGNPRNPIVKFHIFCRTDRPRGAGDSPVPTDAVQDRLPAQGGQLSVGHVVPDERGRVVHHFVGDRTAAVPVEYYHADHQLTAPRQPMTAVQRQEESDHVLQVNYADGPPPPTTTTMTSNSTTRPRRSVCHYDQRVQKLGDGRRNAAPNNSFLLKHSFFVFFSTGFTNTTVRGHWYRNSGTLFSSHTSYPC